MTEGVVKTQGTELFTVDALSSSVASVLKFECPTGITGLGGAADQLETTCLDTVGDKEFTGGLGNPGQVSVPFKVCVKPPLGWSTHPFDVLVPSLKRIFSPSSW